MSDVLLVHGAANGAWCWHRVVTALAAYGHRARAIDLPSHGDDMTDPATVTLDAYADAILAATRGPTLLVGHSMGDSRSPPPHRRHRIVSRPLSMSAHICPARE